MSTYNSLSPLKQDISVLYSSIPHAKLHSKGKIVKLNCFILRTAALCREGISWSVNPSLARWSSVCWVSSANMGIFSYFVRFWCSLVYVTCLFFFKAADWERNIRTSQQSLMQNKSSWLFFWDGSICRTHIEWIYVK